MTSGSPQDVGTGSVKTFRSNGNPNGHRRTRPYQTSEASMPRAAADRLPSGNSVCASHGTSGTPGSTRDRTAR
jgi:hypothetical protein